MSNPSAQPRTSKRRRRTSNLFLNGAMGTVLVVGCIFAVWGAGPLKRAWIALGFGSPTVRETDKIRTPAPGPVDKSVRELKGSGDSRPIVPPPPLPLADIGRDEFLDETTDSPFIPEKRQRRSTRIERPSDSRPSRSAFELDGRFDADTAELEESDSNAVRTAEFQEPAPSAPSRPKFPKHKKIQFEVETIETNLESSSGNDIRRIAEEVPANPKVTTPAKRSGTKVKPASVSPERGELPNIRDAKKLIDEGRDAEAYQILSEAYMRLPADRAEFQDLLDTVANRIYFSPQPQIEPPYEIQPNDQLRKIASKFHLSWQYLARLNQVDAKKIRAGKKLKVFQGPFSAKVDLSDFELVVFLGGKYVKRYQVGVGKANSSPIGEFTVREKLENPTYYGPEGNVLGADDPLNPLGERWIDIGNSFGIHGTIEPNSIGKNESAGCIRMRNDDVAEVYDLLTIGSAVSIQR